MFKYICDSKEKHRPVKIYKDIYTLHYKYKVGRPGLIRLGVGPPGFVSFDDPSLDTTSKSLTCAVKETSFLVNIK